MKVVKKSSLKKAVGLPDFSPTSVLRATEKAGKAALLIYDRCVACHGQTVAHVLKPVPEKPRYTRADLKYDLKLGRLEIVKPPKKVGPVPVSKNRPAAPCAGEALPDANINEFFRFLACQTRFECKYHTGVDVPLHDNESKAMWPDVEAFITPNIGATERWIPYHTILGKHELFLVTDVHSMKEWTEKQRFLAIFVFRAHCKCDLFKEVQLPIMRKKSFWEDPIAAFKPGGPMEKSMRQYRRKTKKPLLTSCFRIIPERLLQDDDENLIRSITNRTMRLLNLGEACYGVLKSKQPPKMKLDKLSSLVQQEDGCGETWAKMLTVCMDLAYPKEQLLEAECDVGTGALKPLFRLLPKGATQDKKKALSALLQIVNSSKTPSAKHFWSTLGKVESKLRCKFKSYPLVLSQICTKQGKMTAQTLQVQLCEYRQYRHSIARLKYGLPDDKSMRNDPEELKPKAMDFIALDPKRNVVTLHFIGEDSKTISTEVSVRAAGCNKQVARGVAKCMFDLMKKGMSKQEAEKFRDKMLKDYAGGEDVPENSQAWEICRVQTSHPNPLCSFQIEKNGNKIAFQTTVGAAGGSILQAERIARLCWQKLQAGVHKEKVKEYRDREYAALGGNKRKAAEGGKAGRKKQRTS
eukprot:gnl/MRDRNA2_/MRDRNA2_81267_c0_seq1.p1 gnl/MRDRNA2_/MRDRNA2_81267_c0~~gnl/MRDRNA2_/MRDRNA2_81267_c0_seq1.p1  ORF type:complete len:636 (-),score=134.70 gnl/MRDRNA2_/MRDRNA2_81267_c0_seq1:164-2071(-)